MSGLPKGWAQAPLADIASIQLGKMLDKAKNQGEPTRYLRNVNVRWFAFDLSDVSEMLMDSSEREIYSIKNGDVFICEGGEPGRCAVWNGGAVEIAFQKALHRVRPTQAILPQLIAYQIKLDAITHHLDNYFTGTTIKHLPLQNLQRYPVSVPPQVEQKRIADKLDTLLARIDACRERLEKVPKLIKRFRKSVLAAAQSGNLTVEWREKNGVSELWQQATVQQVAMVGTGSTPLRSNPEFFSADGIPWITSSATSHVMVRQASEFVTEAAIKAHRLKKYPPGTLLVAMYGEGKTRGQVTELAIEATINQACAAVVVDESKANRSFVKLMLQANYIEMRELAEGGNQPNLNLSKVKEFEIPLPCLEEQAEIVRRVEKFFGLADALETRLRTARTAANRLIPATLSKAFRGELVPQDPNDEPAQLLLERLKSESGGMAPARRGRRPAAAASSNNETTQAVQGA